MNRLHDVTELLVSSWALGTDLDAPDRIPTSHGVLDRALKRLKDKGLLPQLMNDEFHFADSRVGLQCIELADVLEWAQRAGLTSVPNPSYHYTELKIRKRIARKLLERVGVDVATAERFGRALRAELNEVMRLNEALEAANPA